MFAGLWEVCTQEYFNLFLPGTLFIPQGHFSFGISCSLDSVTLLGEQEHQHTVNFLVNEPLLHSPAWLQMSPRCCACHTPAAGAAALFCSWVWQRWSFLQLCGSNWQAQLRWCWTPCSSPLASTPAAGSPKVENPDTPSLCP